MHAAIYVFLRLITYCWCSSNNRTETVLQLFNDAVTKYGLSLKVRTDQGIENVSVWEHMYHIHENSNAVVLVNQFIIKGWKDYAETFTYKC